MRRVFPTLAVTMLASAVWASWPDAEHSALAQQKSDRVDQQGGRVSEMKFAEGDLLRPMVPEGGAGPAAVEGGTFNLRVGDMLELECAIPRKNDTNLTFRAEDEGVIKLIPAGVRRLIPLSMVDGSPKPLTGMIRCVAIFQARKEGETKIRLALDGREFEYGVKVVRE